MLVIFTPLSFLSVGQGGTNSSGALCMAFPLQTEAGPPACDLPPLLFFVPPQRTKPHQTVLHVTLGSSIAAQLGARNREVESGSGNRVKDPRLLQMLGKASTHTQIVPGQGWRDLLMHVGVC